MKLLTGIAAVLQLFLLSSCTDSPAGPGPADPGKAPDASLIAVVENNDILPDELEAMYPALKTHVDPSLAGLFGVPLDSLNGKTLSEIVESYGEDWMISRIRAAAEASYKEVTILTDETATHAALLEALRAAKDKGRVIDVLLDMHASSTRLSFSGGQVDVTSVTNSIAAQDLRIRALYQTCCHASHHLEAWSGTGIAAVCGAVAENSMNLFAPVVFLQLWTGGAGFTDAVGRASGIEVDSMKYYDAKFGLFGILVPGEQEINDSRQLTAGARPGITFRDSYGLGKRPRLFAGKREWD